MKKLFTLLTLISLGIVAVFAHAATRGPAADTSHGQYVAHASNCLSCHTFDSGAYAGGVPFGVANSPNITPDNETGIGDYSFEDFEKAIRQGVSKKGFSLSPMMPPAFSIMTDEDIRALYEFMHNEVPAIKHAVSQPNQNREFTGAREAMPFRAAQGENATVARGRYLVEGLGHCGFCHTERNEQGSLKAQWAHQGSDFLAGSYYDGWIPINLRGDNLDGLARRSEDDLTQFFLTGRNDATAAFGKMTDVVENSTQYLTLEDATAMARFLKTLPPKDPDKPPFKEDTTVARQLLNGDDSKTGASVYLDSCAACHRTSGSGYQRFFPELRGNPVTMSENPASLIHIVLMGQTLPALKAAPSSITMPPFGWRLSDQQIADVVTFIRTSWGNTAPTVTAEEVRKMREDESLFSDKRIFGDTEVKNLLNSQYQ